MHDAQQTAAEAIPNRSNGDWHFEQVFGEAPQRENRPVYSARRDLSGGKNPLDSDFRDLLQFSVSSPDAARQLFGASGLELGRPASTEYENNFHPRTFPSTWRPLSLSADLELWRSGSAIAWLDAENLAVYMVLPPGWQPRQ